MLSHPFLLIWFNKRPRHRAEWARRPCAAALLAVPAVLTDARLKLPPQVSAEHRTEEWLTVCWPASVVPLSRVFASVSACSLSRRKFSRNPGSCGVVRPNVIDRLWDTKCPLHMKSLGQRSQRNGLSALLPLLCERIWNNRLPFKGKLLPHSVHTNGRSPVWHRIWFTRCSCNKEGKRNFEWVQLVNLIINNARVKIENQRTFLVNGFEHTLQQCDESPVCWRRWLLRCSFLVNVLWQNSHLCGDSPVWIRTWFVKCSLRVNDLEQKWHRCGDSPVCWRTWFVKCSFLVKDLVQYWHLCGDSPVCCLTWFTKWSILPRKCFWTILTAERRLSCTFYNQPQFLHAIRRADYPVQGEFCQKQCANKACIEYGQFLP